MSENMKSEEKEEKKTLPAASSGGNNTTEKQRSKQTAELLANWYSSYYAWNIAYMNSAIINSNIILAHSHSNPYLNSIKLVTLF